MYTQCPDCKTAFRVTADVLRQAAGKVRCGGCGSAFNALDFLSESRPEQQAAQESREGVPELLPEQSPDAGLPKSISAAQSAALLKTLDELAGSNIRIEDTGVEWRVLDEDEVGEAADDAIAIDVDVEDQPAIDEILENSPTPVDQFLTETPPQIDSPEIFMGESADPARTPIDELRFDDNTPLPDDFDLVDAAAYPPPEKIEDEDEPEPVHAAEPPVDFDLSEPEEWSDILDEFEDLGDEAQDDDAPLDMDTQFALQAEAMGIELSGTYPALDPGVEDEAGEPSIEEDLDALLDELGAEEPGIEDLIEADFVDEVDDVEAIAELDEDDELEDTLAGLEQDEDDEPDFIAAEAEEAADDDMPAQLALIDATPGEQQHDAESRDEADAEPSSDHVVPPMSEEEQTINMQIDQDLLAIAVEDHDGFASTIVFPEEDAETRAAIVAAGRDEPADGFGNFADTGAGFETIIMEGEMIRSDLDEDKLAAAAAAAANLAGSAAAERAAETDADGDRGSYGMVAGIVVLGLMLLGQLAHQSRDSLATIPAFNDTVGPLYRAVGQPLTPDWDITGWRFEATRGSTDEGNENLTIYSRIGNKAERALPYPLVSVSLTDRFEETIGNRVLDPAEYLSNDLDPRKLVEPGNTFNAIITIQSPAAEATGFKLNVCYRESSGNLRCAIDDFK